MIDFIDGWLTPGLWRMGLWSVQWAVMIATLMAWFAVRPPRTAAMRLLALRLVLVAGLLLPFMPAWWGPAAPRGNVAALSQDTEAATPQLQSHSVSNPTGTALPQTASPATIPHEASSEHEDVVMASNAPVAGPAPVSSDEHFGVKRLAMLLVAIMWCAGVLLQTSRVAVGWIWLLRIRRNAAAPGDEHQAEFDAARRQLGITRPVQLGTHASVRIPILVGGFSPCVLVPREWETLSLAARRNVLLHELVHAQRRDDYSKLAEELVRAVFFFHPFVHWLLARTSADREELCDATVIGQGIAPRDVAGALLECCRMCGIGQSAGMPRSVVLPFFRLPSVKDRIQLLMEDQAMSRWTIRPSYLSIAFILVVVAGSFAAVGSFGLRAADPPVATSEQPASKPDQPPPQQAKSITLPDFLTPENLLDLKAGKPIVIKGLERFGAVTMQELAYMGMAGIDEGPRGRLVDIQGQPIVAQGPIPISARVTALSRESSCIIRGSSTLADAQGRFMAVPDVDGYQAGALNPILVQLAGGQVYESRFVIAETAIVDVHLPTHLHPKVAPPTNVPPDDLAGLVVDEDGRPLEGVEVDLHEGIDPSTRFRTDKQGRFHIKNCAAFFAPTEERIAELRFRKPGYSPERFLFQRLGVSGWVVALGTKTYFEGTVRGADGEPAAGVLIRANQGPKANDTCLYSELWTETTTDNAGRYRLYVQPDAYEFFVKGSPGGVARLPKQPPILFGEQRPLDIALAQGVNFVANIVDSQSGQPVPNVRLWHWQHPGVEGRSNVQGKSTISEMIPGDFEFTVDAKGYTRWWSDDGKPEFNRKEIFSQKLHWQRNFDYLSFNAQPGMKPVTIVVEREVRVRGRVVDPDGKPVSGATVAPALTGSGNSLTGDTRFSVETKADGTFDMSLPASHKARYNLIAHDGKYSEWRTWANGVSQQLFQTKPGQTIDGVEMKLARPATVQGRIVDEQGKPIVGCTVRLEATDKLDNRYYVPDPVKTNSEGRFEMRFLRAGDYAIELRGVHEQPGMQARPLQDSLTLRAGMDIKDVKIRVVQEKRKPAHGPRVP